MITTKINFIDWITLVITLTMLAIATKIGIETLAKFTSEFPWYF